jgi:hypothetical protein
MKATLVGFVLVLACGIVVADPALRRVYQFSNREEISICRHAAKLVDRSPNDNTEYDSDCPLADRVTLQTLLSEVREPLQNSVAQQQKEIEVLTAVVDSLKRQVQDLQEKKATRSQ